MGEEKKTSVIDELKNMGGLPWWLYLLCTFAVLAVAYTDTLGYDAISFIAFVMAFSIVLYKFGKILPIWNTYIGGGLLMVFFGCALLKQFNLIPEGYLELVDTMVQGDVNILSVFIIALSWVRSCLLTARCCFAVLQVMYRQFLEVWLELPCLVWQPDWYLAYSPSI